MSVITLFILLLDQFTTQDLTSSYLSVGEQTVITTKTTGIVENDSEDDPDVMEKHHINNIYMNHGVIHRINTKERFTKLQSKLAKVGVQNTWSITNIQCINSNDFYYLLFKICNHSKLCRELYFFEDVSDITLSYSTLKKYSETGKGRDAYRIRVDNSNLKKFIYQLSLVQLFPIKNENIPSGNSGSNNTTTHVREEEYKEEIMVNDIFTNDRLFLLEENWPVEWIPRYIVTLNKVRNISCSTGFDIMDYANIDFIYASQHLFQTYTLFVKNTHHCYDFNEELKLDEENNFHCTCKEGKKCNSETSYREMIIILMSSLIALLILWTVCYVLSHILTTRKLNEIIKLKSNTNKPILPVTQSTTPPPVIVSNLTQQNRVRDLESYTVDHYDYGFTWR